MLKSCKAAQSAYLDNGGIASSVISLPVLSYSLLVRGGLVEFCRAWLLWFAERSFCCWLLLLWQCSRCPIWREPNCTARVGEPRSIRITPVKEACFMSRKSGGRARGRKDRERIVRNLAFLAQSAAEEKKHQESQVLAQSAAEEKKHQESQVGPKVAKPEITAR